MAASPYISLQINSRLQLKRSAFTSQCSSKGSLAGEEHATIDESENNERGDLWIDKLKVRDCRNRLQDVSEHQTPVFATTTGKSSRLSDKDNPEATPTSPSRT
ncbi:hypothetical protein BELL_0089g00190 [Botrytis elliptica]|uniref:Uncharacterized protein n=1 Tax=Botrytis elliptica TaxID=278938 RepID=A0A4Z1JXE6_9HELO|nr:hypothetical protein BELL_0089g00190 [Botrytis elliptica]